MLVSFLQAESLSRETDDLIDQLLINQTVFEKVRRQDIITLSNLTEQIQETVDKEAESNQQQACKTQVAETTTQLNSSRVADEVILSRAQND